MVEGGESRQESVENALATLAPDTDLVAVHDAVRPFIDSDLVESVIAEAAKTGAAIVGIVPVDTVKQVHKNKIRATLSREHLVMAQTPQVFRFELLKRAFAKARKDGFTGTDEASLVERLEEIDVHVVQGSDRNIKITKPTDMELARLFLSEEVERNSLVSEVTRPGLGWDVHRLAAGRPLILGASPCPASWASKATRTPTSFRTPSPTLCWARPRWAISGCTFRIPIRAGKTPIASGFWRTPRDWCASADSPS